MRYIILGFIALVIYLLSFVALPAEKDPLTWLTILYYDLALVTIFVGFCFKYWGKKKESSEKIGRILVVQIGVGLILWGGCSGFTGDYIATSLTSRTALAAGLNNFLGEYLHPLVPSFLWIMAGLYLASLGIRGWKNT